MKEKTRLRIVPEKRGVARLKTFRAARMELVEIENFYAKAFDIRGRAKSARKGNFFARIAGSYR